MPDGANAPLSGLTRRLVSDNLIEEFKAREAFAYSEKNNIPLVTHLVKNDLVNSTALAMAAADEFGYPLLDISAFDESMIPADAFDQKLMLKHHIIPLFKRGNKLFIGMSDPTNLQALDDIKFNTGQAAEGIIIEEEKLTEAIERIIQSQDDDALGDGLDDEALDDLEVDSVDEDEGPAGNANEAGADEAPIVRFINKILLDAIKGGASDIHFEPYEKAFRVRFRTDGILHEVSRPPSNLAGRLSARLKVMSQLDISERRLPQDGRIKMKISKSRAIDFRVNSLPTLWGEKIVLRILDPSSAKMGIDALGYEDHQKELYMQALSEPQGMILVTGPTGSGKTVSLYTGLNILNTPERNISTAEDPVEINLEGVNQVQINPKVGFDFSSALRAFLRQDPDIVMVGEIRDLETAEIAVKAAQTGHLVLSTLHTNSAAETLTRLMNMGVPAFNIATSVSLIIAQRLARRLCTNCKKPITIPTEELEKQGFNQDMLDNLHLCQPVGCEKCNNGYKGRVGVYEVVRITNTIGRIIMEGGNSIAISDAARQAGFNDLRTSGLWKACQGLTSLEEVNRVTKD